MLVWLCIVGSFFSLTDPSALLRLIPQNQQERIPERFWTKEEWQLLFLWWWCRRRRGGYWRWRPLNAFTRVGNFVVLVQEATDETGHGRRLCGGRNWIHFDAHSCHTLMSSTRVVPPWLVKAINHTRCRAGAKFTLSPQYFILKRQISVLSSQKNREGDVKELKQEYK